MSKKLEKLADRRAKLLEQIAIQREDLVIAFLPLRSPLSLADKGLHMLGYLNKHPVLVSGAVAGAVAVAVAMRPKRWLLMLESSWMAWRLLLAAKRKLNNEHEKPDLTREVSHHPDFTKVD